MSSFVSALVSIELRLPGPLFFNMASRMLFSSAGICIISEGRRGVFHFGGDKQFLGAIKGVKGNPKRFVSVGSYFLKNSAVFIDSLNAHEVLDCASRNGFVGIVPFSFDLMCSGVTCLPDNNFLYRQVRASGGGQKV